LLPLALAWKLGWRSTAWFKERTLRRLLRPLAQHSDPSRLLAHDLPAALMAALRPEALRQLEQHRRLGHRLLIVSASPRPLLQPLAERLGVELIATETSDPLLTSRANPLRLTSANCKGAEKVRRLEAAHGQPLQSLTIHAYGDSKGDRELLQAADHPHWRSFNDQDVPYPAHKAPPLLPLLAMALLAMLLWGLAQQPEQQRQSLLSALVHLPAWLPALYGVLALTFGLRYVRWRLLLTGLGIGRACPADALGWFQGFALTATPAKLGELSRVQALHRDLAYPRLPLLQVFVMERSLDALAVVVLLAALAPAGLGPLLKGPTPWGHGLHQTTGLGLIAGLACAALGLGLLAARRSLPTLRHRLHQLLAGIRLGPWRRAWPAVLAAAAVSLLIWLCEPLILWLLVQALAPRSISVAAALATYLISGTAGMASTLPAGIGVNEGATVLLLSQQGIPVDLALSIAILRRLLTPWSIVALAAALGGVRLPRQTL
ncbi:MAG: flippase-like domain-containing protein, partial [Cyanobium sp.]